MTNNNIRTKKTEYLKFKVYGPVTYNHLNLNVKILKFIFLSSLLPQREACFLSFRLWQNQNQRSLASLKSSYSLDFMARSGSRSHSRTWWAHLESNQRPPRYQHGALTNWATSPFCNSKFASLFLNSLLKSKLIVRPHTVRYVSSRFL